MKDFFSELKENYATTEGRASRKKFRRYMIFHLGVFTLSVIMDLLLIIYLPHFFLTGFLSLCYGVVTFTPTVAIIIRRLHDIGKSGWLALLLFVPLAGLILFFVLLFKNEKSDEKQYDHTPDLS